MRISNFLLGVVMVRHRLWPDGAKQRRGSSMPSFCVPPISVQQFTKIRQKAFLIRLHLIVESGRRAYVK
jgi:hypothetical protein